MQTVLNKIEKAGGSNKRGCFYTGLPFIAKSKLRKTKEHLIPLVLLNNANFKMHYNNIVSAGSLINNLVGHAPLKLKFELKEFFASFEIADFMTLNNKTLTIKNLYGVWQEQYLTRCHGRKRSAKVPIWDWSTINSPILKETAREKYLKVLTKEERILLNIGAGIYP